MNRAINHQWKYYTVPCVHLRRQKILTKLAIEPALTWNKKKTNINTAIEAGKRRHFNQEFNSRSSRYQVPRRIAAISYNSPSSVPVSICSRLILFLSGRTEYCIKIPEIFVKVLVEHEMIKRVPSISDPDSWLNQPRHRVFLRLRRFLIQLPRTWLA